MSSLKGGFGGSKLEAEMVGNPGFRAGDGFGRSRRRIRALIAGFIVIGGSTVAAVSVGAIGAGSTYSGGMQSTDLASRDALTVVSGSTDLDGRPLVVTDTTERSGDHRIEYSVGGDPVLELTARGGCEDNFAGLANTTPLDGGVRLIGATTKRATSLVITVSDGRDFEFEVHDAGGVGYPFFDIEVPGMPVKFETRGVEVPNVCVVR